MENRGVKNIVMMLMVFLAAPSLVVGANLNVTLQTSSLGYPYTAPFNVSVLFSEPVVGFSLASVSISNGVVSNITGSQANYVMNITPVSPGIINIVIPANEVLSISTNEPNVISNKLSVVGLNPSVHPSSNFDLTQWNITLPLPLNGNQGDAISIGSKTLNGNPNLNTGYINPPYFYTEPSTGAMVFFAPLNGATTPESHFPRCELLEAILRTPPTWMLKTFNSNTLTASLLVSQVPPSKRIIIGQIHDKGNTDSFGHSAGNSPLLKVYYDMNALDPNKQPCNGCIYGQVRKVPAYGNFLKIVNLVKNIPLNQFVNYEMRLLSDGTLTIKANDKSTTVKLSTSTNNTIGWGAQQLYFKAGIYVQDNGNSSVLGGTAKFYSLQVSHT